MILTNGIRIAFAEVPTTTPAKSAFGAPGKSEPIFMKVRTKRLGGIAATIGWKDIAGVEGGAASSLRTRTLRDSNKRGG